MTMPDLTIQLVLMRLLAGVAIMAVQGAVIAAVVVALGDEGPRHDARTNPLSLGHVSLLGLGSMLLTGFGWGQPVAVDYGKLRPGRWAVIVAVMAGSAAVLLLGYLLLLLAGPSLKTLDFTSGLTVAAFVRVAARLCVWIALFSLLPIPPLAGAHILGALGISIPPKTGLYLGWGLLLLSLSGLTQRLLTPAYNVVAPLLLGVDIAH